MAPRTVGGADRGASGLLAVPKQVFRAAMEDDVLGLAAEMSYRFLLALFPFVIFLTSLGAFLTQWTGIDNPTQAVMDLVSGRLPTDARALLEEQVSGIVESRSSGLLSLGIFMALFASSGAMKVIMKGTNRAYDVTESRPFWRTSLIALGFTLLVSVAVIVGFMLLVFGQFFVERVTGAIGLTEESAALVSLARWPIVIVALMVAAALLYRTAPNVDLPLRWLTPGAVFFVLGWLITTAAFGFYVGNFGSYNETYGALGGVIVLLLWLYLTGVLLLTGAELNAVLDRRNAPPKPTDARPDAPVD